VVISLFRRLLLVILFPFKDCDLPLAAASGIDWQQPVLQSDPLYVCVGMNVGEEFAAPQLADAVHDLVESLKPPNFTRITQSQIPLRLLSGGCQQLLKMREAANDSIKDDNVSRQN